MSLDVAAARARFSALQRNLVFFDGPGGTQVPDTVIEAVSDYFRHMNANTSGPYETSRKTEALAKRTRETAGRFLNSAPDEVVFGPNMTTLNFALTRTVAREFRAGDEIVVTKLDHDGNVAPWLELAHDLGLVVRFSEIHEDTTLDLDDLESKLSDRTKVVAFPVASNAVGTLTDVSRIVELAHSVGALAWADAVHYGPHGPIDVASWDIDVLLCSPYKYFGPRLGIAYGRRELLESWRPYKVRPHPDVPLGSRFETGTPPYELWAGFVAAVEYIESLGWEDLVAWDTDLGTRFLAGLPANVRLYGLPSMEGRVPTFAFSIEGIASAEAAARLGERGFAAWHGNYYALEVMKRLGLEDDGGAVRVGFVHYNTGEEVDRLLAELARLE
jgi:cysteine desulfurase family protein (TIGR01976 family)